MINVNFDVLKYNIIIDEFYKVIFNYTNLDIKIIQEILPHLIMIFDNKKINDMKIYIYIYKLYIIFFNNINHMLLRFNLYEKIEEYQKPFKSYLVGVLEDIIYYLKNKHSKILILTLNRILNESRKIPNINITIKPYLEEQIKKFKSDGRYFALKYVSES
jgi:hypothetical protein